MPVEIQTAPAAPRAGVPGKHPDPDSNKGTAGVAELAGSPHFANASRANGGDGEASQVVSPFDPAAGPANAGDQTTYTTVLATGLAVEPSGSFQDPSNDLLLAGVSSGSPTAPPDVAAVVSTFAVSSPGSNAGPGLVASKDPTTTHLVHGTDFGQGTQPAGQQNSGYAIFGAAPASLQIDASARAAPQPNGGAVPNTAQVLEQVAYAIQFAHRGGDEMRLHLSPADLGSLQVNVSVHDGVLSARLEAQNPATQQLLSDNLSQLKDALTQQGVVFDRIDVHLAGSHTGFGGAGNAGSSYRGQQEGGLPWNQPQNPASTEGDEPVNTSSRSQGSVSRISPTSLDIMV